MTDPYSVLGVSPQASDDEIKKAYRELARKYHPDSYKDNPLSDLAEEKMKEINEAYDTVMKSRGAGHGASGSGGSSSRTGQSYGSYTGSAYGANRAYSGQSRSYNYNYTGSGSNAGPFYKVRQDLNANRLDEAERELNGAAARNAEWYFLRGALCQKRGWMDEAMRCYETACNMEPSNNEYRSAMVAFQNQSNPYGTVQQNECGGMDCCTSLLCANLLCSCCGGGRF